MKDRIPYPGQEGRVLIRFEDGTEKYAIITMADNPIEEGTALKKANLLSDKTAELLGFTAADDPTVDDALQLISTAPKSFMQNDLYMYIMQTHPILFMSPYKDAYMWAQPSADHRHAVRTISLTGNAQDITVYDSYALAERI